MHVIIAVLKKKYFIKSCFLHISQHTQRFIRYGTGNIVQDHSLCAHLGYHKCYNFQNMILMYINAHENDKKNTPAITLSAVIYLLFMIYPDNVNIMTIDHNAFLLSKVVSI